MLLTFGKYTQRRHNVHTICCGDNVCDHQINMMNYADYVGNYNSLQAVQKETGDANFTYALVDMMKRFNTDQCLYNTMVLITNRLFVTDELKLGKDCIKPCGPKVKDECLNVQLIDCPYPPITESPVTPTIGVTSTIPADNISSSYWYLMYVFALSNRTTDDEFKRVVNFIQTPLQHCANQRDKITVRFLAKNNVDTGWLFHLANITSFLQSLQADKVLLNSVNSTVNEDVTLDLIRKAISIPHGQDGTREPRITLLTDFVSQNFIDAYNNKSDTLMHDLQYFDFEIDSFNAVDISVG
uniref:VP1054 n=1 Tax=Heterorhabditis bacteriophora TaxID=37862 RepID=A0A1I7XJX2_HETBA